MDGLALLTNGWPTSAGAVPVVELVEDLRVVAEAEEELVVTVTETSTLTAEVDLLLELVTEVKEIY